MAPRTDAPQRIVACIEQSWRERGYAPTFREIAAQVGLQSVSTVNYHLRRLRKKGLIRWEPGLCRSLAVIKDCCPHCGK